jgi:hypothetical protein
MGLTQDVIVVMETQDVDIMVKLLDIENFRLLYVISPVDRLQIKLEMICDKLNNYAVLQFGLTLTNAVVPHPYEVRSYNRYTMPEGGAYVWDAWRTTRNSNPNIVMFVRLHADYGSQ